MGKIILLILVMAQVAIAYSAHLLIRKKVDPRQSAGMLLLYVFLHMALIFLTVFAVSFIIFRVSSTLVNK